MIGKANWLHGRTESIVFEHHFVNNNDSQIFAELESKNSMKTYLTRIGILLLFPLALLSCEGEFSKYLLLENQSSRTLIIPTNLNTPGSVGNDTLFLQPGETDTIQSFYDPVARGSRANLLYPCLRYGHDPGDRQQQSDQRSL